MADKETIEIKIPRPALQSKGAVYRFLMPYTDEDYKGYTYGLSWRYAERKDGELTIDEDGCYTFRVPKNYSVTVQNADKKERIPVDDFKETLSSAPSYGYDAAAMDMTAFSVPKSQIEVNRDGHVIFSIPEIENTHFYLDSRYVTYTKKGIDVKMPSVYKLRYVNADAVKDGKGGALRVSARDLNDVLTASAINRKEDKEIEDAKVAQATHVAEAKDNFNYSTDRSHATFSAAALVYAGDNVSYFRMPAGKYGECEFYYPNEMITANEDGTVTLEINPKSQITLSRSPKLTQPVVSAEVFRRELNGKKGSEFPGSTEDLFGTVAPHGNRIFGAEAGLRKNIPEELKGNPNWAVVQRVYKPDGTYTTRYVNPYSGKPADAFDPLTLGTFEDAMKFAKENGGYSLAYVPDGKDGITCLSLNGKDYLCKDGPTENYKTFSNDGKQRLYKGGHFVEMPANLDGELRPMSENGKKKIAKDFSLRSAKENASADNHVIKMAMSSKDPHSRKLFTALFNGETVTGNKSKDAQMLMDRLAFWCDKDTDQMMRIFQRSGQADRARSIEKCEDMCCKALDNCCYTRHSKEARANTRRLNKENNFFTAKTKSK